MKHAKQFLASLLALCLLCTALPALALELEPEDTAETVAVQVPEDPAQPNETEDLPAQTEELTVEEPLTQEAARPAMAEPEAYPEMEQGKAVEVTAAPRASAFCTFTPQVSGLYVFFSTERDNADPWGGLRTSPVTTGSTLAEDAGNGKTFRFPCQLTAGTTYYLEVWNPSETSAFTIPVTVQKQEPCGTCGEQTEWAFNTDTGELTLSGTGAVTETPWREFYQDAIRAVTVEQGVTAVPGYACDGCRNLTGVKLADTVTAIGSYAFNACSSLNVIDLGSGLETIGYNAFYSCQALSAISLPDRLTTIGEEAFRLCTELTRVDIPASVTSIGDNAFRGCNCLSTVTIPAGVTGFGENTFWGTPWQTNQGAFPVVNGVLLNYQGEDSVVTVPENVTVLAPAAFEYQGVTEVILPQGVTTIGDFAFYGCEYLEKITIPASVTAIGADVFCACPSTQTIYGYANSYAQQYAGDRGIPFVSLGTAQPEAVSLSDAAITLSVQSVTYTGKAHTPPPTVKLDGKTLKKGTDYTVTYQNNTNAGTAKVIVTGKGSYTGTKTGTFTIKKANQTMTVTAPAIVVKGKTIKLTVKNPVGKLTYATSNKAIATVSAATVKGIKQGTVTITVKAAGDRNRNACTKAVKITVYTLAAPAVSKVENVPGGVKITAGKVTGAAKYRFFVKKGSGAWAKAGDSASNIFTWKKAANGVQYSFSACCLDKNGTAISDYNKTGKSIVYIAAPTLTNPAAKTMKAAWQKAAGVTGYEVQYAASAGFSGARTVKITKAGTLNTTVKNLVKGKTYFVRVRTYTVKNGKTTCSAWSGAASVRLSQ